MNKMGIVRNTYFKPIENIIRHAYKQRYCVKNVVFKESGDFVAIGDGFAIENNAYDFDTCLTPSNNLQLRLRGEDVRGIIMIMIENNGRIVRKSKNLRGILDYSRSCSVVRVELTKLPDDAGSMLVIFHNGATSRANFASFSIMQRWVDSRRSWNCEIVDYSIQLGSS